MELYDEFYDNELYHHGIRGMKWGVRRYQNKDGSLTNAGAKRYNSGKSIGERFKEYKTAKTRQKNLKKARAVQVQRKKESEKRQKLIKDGKIKTKDMTNEELANHITRLEQERRLKQLQQETAVYSKGQKFVKTMMDKVVTPAATSAGEQFLRRYLNDVGDDVLSAIKDAKAKQDPNKRMAAENENLRTQKTNLELKRDIEDLKSGKKPNDDPNKDLKNENTRLRLINENRVLADEDLQTQLTEAKRVQAKNTIANPKYDSDKDDDKDKNINGLDDDYEYYDDDDDKKNKK